MKQGISYWEERINPYKELLVTTKRPRNLATEIIDYLYLLKLKK